MNQTHSVVIVGGGFAGVKAALELSNKPGISVTLLTIRSRFEYHGALYRSATGRSPLEVAISMRDIFKSSANIDVVIDRMTALRAHTNEVVGESGRSYEYDSLVLALGTEVNYFGNDIMEERAETIYGVSQTIKLRNRLVELFKNFAGKSAKITVVGGGATGVELASDIQTFATAVSEKYSLPLVDLNVELVEGGERLMPLLTEYGSQEIQKRLESLGVSIILNKRIDKCEEHGLCISEQKVETDMLVWTAGSKVSGFFATHPELFSLDQRGRVIVGEHLNANSPNIFVIGDSAATIYSGMAQTAIYDGAYVAKNITNMLSGLPYEQYLPTKPKYAIPLGDKWAYVESGDSVSSGEQGWKERREADRWVLENFLPYNLATLHWEKGDDQARY